MAVTRLKRKTKRNKLKSRFGKNVRKHLAFKIIKPKGQEAPVFED